ncbi:MAG TPA: hypothetical protein V6C76_01600 [Drouetiella sp.]
MADKQKLHPAEADSPHLEIELKVALLNKAEEKEVKKRLKGLKFKRERSSLIIDFIQPNAVDTKRIRLETSLHPVAGSNVTCVLGNKSHPIAGALSDFVRRESENTVNAEDALRALAGAMLSNDGEPVPYYTKRRHYFRGNVGGYEMCVSLDKPRGLLRRFSKRYLEVEVQLPESSNKAASAAAVKAVNEFVEKLTGRKPQPEPSYRRMVRETWDSR